MNIARIVFVAFSQKMFHPFIHEKYPILRHIVQSGVFRSKSAASLGSHLRGFPHICTEMTSQVLRNFFSSSYPDLASSFPLKWITLFQVSGYLDETIRQHISLGFVLREIYDTWYHLRHWAFLEFPHSSQKGTLMYLYLIPNNCYYLPNPYGIPIVYHRTKKLSNSLLR